MIEQITDKQNKVLFHRACINMDTLDYFSLNDVIDLVNQAGFCCLRGLIGENELIQARSVLQSKFSRANDNPGIGEQATDVQRNYQKIRAGISPAKPANSRLLRTFYNPLWEQDIYQMHGLFRTMVAVRNTLLAMPLDFAADTIDNGLWTAARIQQYPLGGGFMSAHKDEQAINSVSDSDLDYLQILLVMSRKGEDYHSGGGFVIRDGKFIDIDQNTQLGDIIIYNGNTVHGVDTIDPDKLLDMDHATGRLAAFVTLYKHYAV